MPLQYPAFDALIAQFEGFGQAGVPATVNNNPGNLIAGDFSTAHGAVAQNGPFAVFPDVATGTAAQDALVSHYANQGLTIDQLIQKWSPGNATGNTPAGTQSYSDFLSTGLGVPGTTTITDAQKKTTDVSTSSPTSISPTQSTSILGQINNAVFTWLNGRAPGQTSAEATGQQAAFTFARVGAFILGFVLIAGGLYLFKPVQETVNTAAKGAIAA